MTVWAILILTVLVASIGLATASANDSLIRELRVEHRARMGVGNAVLMMLASLAAAALWTVYAFEVGDWRFAAIQWVPIVMGLISRAAVRAKSKPASESASVLRGEGQTQ